MGEMWKSVMPEFGSPVLYAARNLEQNGRDGAPASLLWHP